MIGEEKSEIFKSIPEEYYPKTILIKDQTLENILAQAKKIGYPLIAKPNIGERGRGVEFIRDANQLNEYASKIKVDFLLQEYVDHSIELGVFYIRRPNESIGSITSIVVKEFLSIRGDGVSTLRMLIQNTTRGSLQVEMDHKRLQPVIDTIPKEGETIVVEPIGNHCRGTKFLNGNDQIDDELNLAFDKLAKKIPNFYYGRFDLKCKSFDDLKKLENFKIVELNGVGAEPAHIYQPGFSLRKAYQTVFWHFSEMAKIGRTNRKSGIRYWTLREGIRKLLDIRAYNRRLTLQNG